MVKNIHHHKIHITFKHDGVIQSCSMWDKFIKKKNRSDNSNVHMEQVHYGIILYQCNLQSCNKKNKNSKTDNLTVHMEQFRASCLFFML